MNIGKFEFKPEKEGGRLVIKAYLMWNKSFAAVHDAETLEKLSTTMPGYLEAEYISLLKKNKDNILKEL